MACLLWLAGGPALPAHHPHRPWMRNPHTDRGGHRTKILLLQLHGEERIHSDRWQKHPNEAALGFIQYALFAPHLWLTYCDAGGSWVDQRARATPGGLALLWRGRLSQELSRAVAARWAVLGARMARGSGRGESVAASSTSGLGWQAQICRGRPGGANCIALELGPPLVGGMAGLSWKR